MRRRDAVFHLKDKYLVSERRACVVTGQPRSTQRNLPVLRQEECFLLQKIEQLVRDNPRCGYRRITAMLRLEGWRVNHKRIHRLWKQEGYRVPTPKKKSKASGSSMYACNKKIAKGKNDIWTYDFIFDRLENGRALKILAVTDEYTRESLALIVGESATGATVASVLDRLSIKHGFPNYVRSDNGSEFTSSAVKKWFAASGTEGLYVEKGAPWQNGYAESFNSRFRDECLNMNLFSTVKEASAIIADWQSQYNHRRPHSALGGLPPSLFAEQWAKNNHTTTAEILSI